MPIQPVSGGTNIPPSGDKAQMLKYIDELINELKQLEELLKEHPEEKGKINKLLNKISTTLDKLGKYKDDMYPKDQNLLQSISEMVQGLKTEPTPGKIGLLQNNLEELKHHIQRY